MGKRLLILTLNLSVVAFAAALLLSCEEGNEVIPVQEADTLKPTEISFNTDILLSDSALLKIKVSTPKLLRFSDEDDPYVEFPDGLTLFLYDTAGAVESTLTADYGVHYPDEKRVLVKNNVKVENNRGETLNTEELTWLRDERRIFTEAFVKITTPDEILLGTGLESNESFTKYRIKNIEGTISAGSDDEEL